MRTRYANYLPISEPNSQMQPQRRMRSPMRRKPARARSTATKRASPGNSGPHGAGGHHEDRQRDLRRERRGAADDRAGETDRRESRGARGAAQGCRRYDARQGERRNGERDFGRREYQCGDVPKIPPRERRDAQGLWFLRSGGRIDAGHRAGPSTVSAHLEKRRDWRANQIRLRILSRAWRPRTAVTSRCSPK